MKSIIKKYNIDGIWHFTDKSNLKSMEKYGGLLSLEELTNKDIEIPVPGGNEWSHDADISKGLDKYVHLSFVSDHPMLFKAKKEERIKKPIWLKIVVSVMLDPEVRFTSDISNKSGVVMLAHEEAVNEIDFEVLFSHMNWNDPEINKRRQNALKSEILVPDIVPNNKILGYING